jgi:intracellular multiplication protein IcmC
MSNRLCMTGSLVITSLLVLYPLSAQAGMDANVMMAQFVTNFPALWKLTTAVAYLIGFIFMFRAVRGFKEYGERGGGHHHHGPKTPLVLFFVGCVLIFTPSTVNVLMMSTFGYASPLAYPQTSGKWDQYQNVFLLINLIGAISFVRGWVIIAGAAQQGGHTSMGKAITHIVGGLLAINIQGTIDIMRRTFGLAG